MPKELPDPPELNLTNIELSDVIDAPALQELMDAYFALNGLAFAIIDIKGEVLVAGGWQEICVKFHRAHPESCKFCHESDISLSSGIAPGTFKTYRCKNNLWDIVTPIMLGERHVGNIFMGQLFFDDEEIDYELFRAQAKRFDYDEVAYIAAVDRVPRCSREVVNTAMSFCSKLGQMVSKSNYNNKILADTLAKKELAEEALRESETKLSNLFASMTEMVVLHELLCDGAGKPVNYRIIDCNAAYTRITGITRDHAVGRLAPEVYGTEEPPYLKEFSEVALSGESCHFEIYFPPMDKHFFISVVSPEKNHFATVTTDITEQKRAEEAIEAARNQLAAKNKELEQLVYVVSHDLRSPLVNVDGFSRELEYSVNELSAIIEGGGDYAALEKALRAEFPDMVKSIGRIRASTRQMDNLLKALLKLARAGRAALRIETLNMDELLGQLGPSFAFQLRETGMTMTVEKLPHCQGDAVQVTQAFSNLIDNAIKYHQKDRPGVITIRGTAEGGRVLYRVEDNGMGIAESHREKIFELFHRLNPKEGEGEGLGLTLVRQILGGMNGEITVESKTGEGSAFIVSLPDVKKNRQ